MDAFFNNRWITPLQNKSSEQHHKCRFVFPTSMALKCSLNDNTFIISVLSLCKYE